MLSSKKEKREFWRILILHRFNGEGRSDSKLILDWTFQKHNWIRINNKISARVYKLKRNFDSQMRKG